MRARAAAPAAGTVLNALANGYGSAFAIDAYTEATVELDGSGTVDGEAAGEPDADTRLIERCVESVVERFGDGEGGHVRTESEVPMASGLKSSSAAANATVLATLAALDVDIDREDACRIGVEAARDAGVTVTGAFDDASASMLGGVTVTDNTEDELLGREEPDWHVLVYTPDERGFSSDADVSRCERIAPMADIALGLATDGEYRDAMCVNGFAFCAALDRSTEPIVEALPNAAASLSGTGPSYTAVGDRETLARLADTWSQRTGETWLTTTQQTGATIR